MASFPLQVSIRTQIYFYVRARMSAITHWALMGQWELGAEMGWSETVKHGKLHQPFHVCLTCFLTPDRGLVFIFVPADWAFLPWDRVSLPASKGHCVLDGILRTAGVSVINTHSDCIIFHSSVIWSIFTLFSAKWICFFCFWNKLQNEKSHSKHLRVMCLGD